MGQMRAPNFSHGLPCVVEEAPHQDVAAAAEQRRQHILESMAKLEGSSRTTSAPPSPSQSISRPFNSTQSRVKAGPISQQFEPFPSRPSFTGFPLAPQVVPYFYYYPVYPTNLMPMPMPMPNHFVERNSTSSFNPSLTTGPKNLKHTSASIDNRGRSQQLGRMNSQPDNLLNDHRMSRRNSEYTDIVKTPEQTYRSRSALASPESPSESFLSTPPSILKYTAASHNQSDQPKKNFKLQFSEPHQHHAQQYQSQQILKEQNFNQPNTNQLQPVNFQRSNDYSNESTKIVGGKKKKFKNLISFNNNYALQLESKKTGIKLVEKKELTLDEVKALSTLPPLPPRPNPGLLAPLKKEKKDPFAWFHY